MTYISQSNDFALYLEDCLMDEHYTWDFGSMLHKNWPHINVAQCDQYFVVYFLMDECQTWNIGSV